MKTRRRDLTSCTRLGRLFSAGILCVLQAVAAGTAGPVWTAGDRWAVVYSRPSYEGSGSMPGGVRGPDHDYAVRYEVFAGQSPSTPRMVQIEARVADRADTYLHCFVPVPCTLASVTIQNAARRPYVVLNPFEAESVMFQSTPFPDLVADFPRWPFPGTDEAREVRAPEQRYPAFSEAVHALSDSLFEVVMTRSNAWSGGTWTTRQTWPLGGRWWTRAEVTRDGELVLKGELLGEGEQADLQVEGTIEPNPVPQGGAFRCRTEVRNLGPDTAGRVRVNCDLPPVFELIATSPPAVVEGEHLSWMIGDLPYAGRTSVVLVARARLADDSVVSTAVRSEAADRDPANNEAVVPVSVRRDTDGDGLPDDWEEAYGLDPNRGNDSDRDPDQDGMTNWQEFQAGTNPLDPQSRFVLRLEPREGPVVRIAFPSTLGREYRLETSQTVHGPAWNTVPQFVSGTGYEMVVQVPVGDDTAYFRVRASSEAIH